MMFKIIQRTDYFFNRSICNVANKQYDRCLLDFFIRSFNSYIFNFIISTNDIPDYFLLTELDSEEPTQHEVGEIDLEKVTQLYQLEFTSQDFVNNFGVWRFKVYKKIIL